jgi:hypothetical protein
MLDATKKANFTDANIKEIQEAFAVAATWARRTSGDQHKLEREQAAANVWAGMLRQTSDQAWADAAAGAERLLNEFDDTLLVRLFSDGSILPSAPLAEVTPLTEPGADTAAKPEEKQPEEKQPKDRR